MFPGENIILLARKSIRNEINYFKSLHQKARSLLISYSLQGAAYPLTSTFVNAYIWRNQESILSLALYNVGNFIALPISFYINGLILRKVKLTTLYFTGAFLSAVSSVIVVFFKSFNSTGYFFYGLLYGVGFGLYWANRNYLTLKGTVSENRNYFIGLNFSIDTLTSIVIPVLTGWFLVAGEALGLYSTDLSYKLMILTALILLSLSGLIVLRGNYESPIVKRIFLPHISKRWNGIRILILAIGITEGIAYFLPTIIILTFLGNEGVLGSFDSTMAVLILIINYYYGRKAKVSHQKSVFIISFIFGLLSSIILFIFQAKFAVITFLALNYVAGNLTWLSSDPMVMDVMDNERDSNKISDYSMVFDRELFLNTGRIISVLIVTILLLNFNQHVVITSTYLVAYVIEGVLIALFWKRITGVNRIISPKTF